MHEWPLLAQPDLPSLTADRQQSPTPGQPNQSSSSTPGKSVKSEPPSSHLHLVRRANSLGMGCPDSKDEFELCSNGGATGNTGTARRQASAAARTGC